MPKQKKYIVYYYFDGEGRVEIEAKSEAEAEKKFGSGDFDEKKDIDTSQNYEINRIEAKEL